VQRGSQANDEGKLKAQNRDAKKRGKANKKAGHAGL
jgi:hypothetical protein